VERRKSLNGSAREADSCTRDDRFSARRARGFTLVELSIALALCASALIGLMGMLPVAQAQLRDARRLRCAVEIASTVFASARVTVPALNVADVRYFDASCAPVASATEAAFVAEVTSRADARIPGANAVRVEIRCVPDGTESHGFEEWIRSPNGDSP